MASIQIPNLPAVASLSGSELFEAVQAGTSVKVSLTQLSALFAEGGNIPVDNVVFVDKAGNDANDGLNPKTPVLTIQRAVAIAQSGDTIMINPGTYNENWPIILKRNVSVVGNNLRGVNIAPNTGFSGQNVFLVDGGCYLTGLTFIGHQAGAWAVAFNPNADNTDIGATGLGAFIRKSPYIQNCTSYTAANGNGEGGSTSEGTTGGGMEVDGNKCAPNSPIRSMVVDSYTFVNLDGPGCLVTNDAYAQLVSCFGTFCSYHVKTINGGQVNLTNSTTDFGTKALVSSGKSTTPLFQGTSGGAIIGAGSINVTGLTPNRIGSSNMPNSGQIFAVGANYYTVTGAVPISGGYSVTFYPYLTSASTSGDTVYFWQRSQITTGGHTMEYVGAGTNYNALPWNGGIPVPVNEITEENQGRIFYSTTDQLGNFRVGKQFSVNGTTGEVTINTSSFNISGLNQVGPFSRDGGITTVGVALMEVSNNNDLIASTGLHDGNTAPTQSAVYNYLLNNYTLSSALGTMSAQNSNNVTITGGSAALTGASSVSTSSASPALTITQTGAGASLLVEDSASPDSTPFIVDANGNVGIGTSTLNNLLTLYSATASTLLVSGDAASAIIAARYSSDANAANLNFRKFRGSVSSPSAVISGDTLGQSNYTAWDGTTVRAAAQISGTVDTFTGTDDVSGFLTFSTRPNGAAGALTERLRVGSAGQFGIGGANYGTTGQTIVSAGSSAAPAWGALGTAGGGTGVTSYTVGDILFASTSSVLSPLADVATGNAIISGGVGAAPSYGKIGLTTHVSGTLPVANGGTGINSYTTGAITYASAFNALSQLVPVVTGNALISNGIGAGPVYGKIGLSTHVSGTLPLANGGLGVTTAPAATAVLMGFTSTATATGTTILDNTSTPYQLFTGTLGQTVQLPAGSTLVPGWTFHIVNNSTGSLTVNSSNGSLLCTVIPNTTTMVTLISVVGGATPAAWEFGFTDFGALTGTGSAVMSVAPGIQNVSLTGSITEAVFAVTGTTPALNPANGTIQTWTLTANSTPTDSLAAGQSITLMIDDGTSFTITWPSVTWKTDSGIAPTLNTTGYTAIVLWKVGSVLYGARVGNA